VKFPTKAKNKEQEKANTKRYGTNVACGF